MITFNRIAPGEFDVLRGGIVTGYRIVNGSLGLSGRDTPNIYGILNPSGRIRWVGTFAACKKIIIYTLSK